MPKTGSLWTPQEDDFLREKFHVMSDSEIAQVLGRTKSAVETRRKILRLLRDPNERINWDYSILNKLSEATGLTIDAIKRRVRMLTKILQVDITGVKN